MEFIKSLKIKNKILLITLASLLIVSIGLSFISYFYAASAINILLEDALVSLSQEGGKNVVNEIRYYETLMEGIANRTWIKSQDWEGFQVPALLEEIDRTDFIGMGVVNKDGFTRYPDGSTAELGDRDYTKRAFNGEAGYAEYKYLGILSTLSFSPIAGPLQCIHKNQKSLHL